ncbi:TetR/AcrR family transcriptional regulator [Lysinibacillus fusiformis]|uniref:TetR/AcrR family transcriptional regulator n=1 Tax=Lysinibacillus fusiformis TaxID=28031 RepID=UPI0030174FB9
MLRNQETKQKILSMASALFQKQGYHATGLNQIIKESGCPIGSLYYYFPDGKEQLATEAINRTKDIAAQELRNLFSQHEDVTQALEYFFEQFLSFNPKVASNGIPLALISLETWHMSEQLRLACKDAYEELVMIVKEKFIQSNWPPAEATEMSYLVFSMIEGGSIFALTYQSNEPLQRICKTILELLDIKQREIRRNSER